MNLTNKELFTIWNLADTMLTFPDKSLGEKNVIMLNNIRAKMKQELYNRQMRSNNK